MLFSSIVFLMFLFPAALLGYYMLFFSKVLQKMWLLMVSLFFYAFGTWKGAVCVTGLIIVNGIFGIMVGALKGNSRKWIRNIGVFCNLLPVLFFKYVYMEGTLMPIGLSFVMLSDISYLCDVYSGETKAVKNPVMLGLYLLYFPKLLAGPVVKYQVFQEQIENRRLTLQRCAVGCCRFVTGLAKKVLLADTLAQLSNIVFNYSAMGRETATVPVVMAWMGLLAFGLQIYFDVSGYADMAIGLSLMFGILMEENVNYPYMAVSVSDFWNRFYISMMNWFRQYVYEPLGGGRSSNMDKMVRNMFLMWLAIGMWYGVNGKFILWCFWQFMFILVEQFFGYTNNTRHTVLMRAYTLTVIFLGWVIFRAQDLYQAGRFYMNMFGVNYNGIWNDMTGILLREYWFYLIIGVFFCTPVTKVVNHWLVEGKKWRACKVVMTICYPIVFAAVLLLSVSYLMQGSASPFLYSLY